MASILRFKRVGDGPAFDFDKQFRGLNGQYLLNSKAWRGKMPRTCSIHRIYGDGVADSGVQWTIEVEHREPSDVVYAGKTRFEGWTVVHTLAVDGVPVDKEGEPLSDGATPIIERFCPFMEEDFNDLNFGEFVGEAPFDRLGEPVKMEELLDQPTAFRASISESTFTAPRRMRAHRMIIILPEGFAPARREPGTIYLNADMPHLEGRLGAAVHEAVIAFLEGRVGLHAIEIPGKCVIDLDEFVLDGSHLHEGIELDRKAMAHLLPLSFIRDLALQVSSLFAVRASLVRGKRAIVLEREIHGPRSLHH